MRKLLVVVAVAVAALGCGDRVFCGEGGSEREGTLYCYPSEDGMPAPFAGCVHPDVADPRACALGSEGCDASQFDVPGRCELTPDGFVGACEGGWVAVCLDGD